MRAKELENDIDCSIRDIQDGNYAEAIKRLQHLKKVAHYKTLKNNEFIDYYKSLKPKPQLYEQVTTWHDPNNSTKKNRKFKIQELEELIKKPNCRFAFMEVTRDYAWMVVSEDEDYDDVPATKYRYFGVKI